MKISYLCYEPVPNLADLQRRMEVAAGLGYAGIELVATHPLGFDAREAVRLSQEFALPIVSILTGWSYAHEGLCLSSPNPAIRDRAVDRLRSYADLAATLGSLMVVGLMQGLRSDEPEESRANDRIAEGLGRVAQAAERGVEVVIEPVNHQQVGFNNTAAEAAAMADRVGSPALGYMLDTIHMNIEERSLLGTIRDYGPRARHVHLCESNGGPFGDGNIDFRAVLTALGVADYRRYASVKVYRKVTWDEAARRAAEFIRGLGFTLGGEP